MKYLNILGIAVAAAVALMAFAASASATILESNGVKTPSETTINSTLTGTASLTTTSGTVLDTCTGGGVKGKTTNEGGEGVPVTGSVPPSGVTWTGCTKTTDTLEGGTLEITWTAGINGTVTGKGFKVTVEMVKEFGGTCSYTLGGGTTLGEFKGTTAGDATLAINAIVNGAAGNSFLCPSDTKWVANYKVTEPTPLAVTNKYP
ncbi:MAG TPA: hypothetical protein VFX35_12130 [Solirubrobacterales bacterium]|nr:hypothetical protein [Solirubrobacterales bacterium]